MNLEQREQEIRNALENVGVKGASQVVKLIGQDGMAEVYINEQYFDTYDFSKARFLEHKLTNDKKTMYVIIYNQNLSGGQCHAGVKLYLPASNTEIETVFEQAGIGKSQECKIEYLRWKDYIFDSDEIVESSLDELNFFGRRVCEMDQEKQLIFEGCLLANQKYQSIKELINLTYSLEDCRVLQGIANDTELGQYYFNNGLVKELEEIPETIAAFIDYEKIGKAMRESENGVFLEGCYITNESDTLTEEYDGVTLPGDYSLENVLNIYINFGDSMLEKSLNLPTDEEKISAFIKDLESIVFSYNSQSRYGNGR